MIDGSRRARIAKGSGRQVTDVNQLVDRFFEARKMMMQMARGGAPGMPGMPGIGLGKKAKGRQTPQPKKAKGKRRLRQPRQAAAAQSAEPAQVEAGSAFGLGGQGVPDDFDPSQLPDLSKYLK